MGQSVISKTDKEGAKLNILKTFASMQAIILKEPGWLNLLKLTTISISLCIKPALLSVQIL